MKKTSILILILALALLTACGGGAKKAEEQPEPTAAPTAAPSPTPTPTAAPTPTPEPEQDKVEWLGYTLRIEERAAMTGSEWPLAGASRNIDDKDVNAGGSYVRFKLTCEDGVSQKDLIDEKVKLFLVTVSNGEELRPFGYNWWGIGFDSKTGFFSSDIQEGFYLVFEIPEGANIDYLRLSADRP